MNASYLASKFRRIEDEKAARAWDAAFSYWDDVADTDYAVKMAKEAAARARREYRKHNNPADFAETPFTPSPVKSARLPSAPLSADTLAMLARIENRGRVGDLFGGPARSSQPRLF